MARPKGSKNKTRIVNANVDYAAVVAEKTAEKEKIESEVATLTANLDDLKKSVNLIRNTPFDLIEWRADFYDGVEDPEVRIKAMTLFRNALGNIPVLFTIRTSVEGGMMEIDTENYTKTILAVIDSGLIDLVDAELSRGEETMKTIVAAAHRVGVKVVASRHDFTATPDKNIIISNLCLMQSLGADIVKFAVMPQCERDVLTLLDATMTMKEEHNETPVITMSMSPAGMISRICGQLVGSCVTFGTAGKASAPGQIPANLLSTFLKTLA